MKKVMSRREMISVLSDFARKHPGCMSNPAYYDSLEDKPFCCDDVLWALQDWKELTDAIEKVCNICFERNIPGDIFRIGCPIFISLNDFIKKYNLPRNVGKVLFQLVKRVNVLAEERRVLS